MILRYFESDGSPPDSRLLTGMGGDEYIVYPANTHWVLIKSSMAADVLTNLCRRDQGLATAIEKAKKFIKDNE